MVNLLQAPSFSKAHSKAHSQQVPHLELCISTSCVSLYPCPAANITTDTLAQTIMMTGPPNHSSSNLTCLLSGPLNDFLLYSHLEQSQWLINITHDVCDPTQKHGLPKVWDALGQVWRDVNCIDPLTASTYIYDVTSCTLLQHLCIISSSSPLYLFMMKYVASPSLRPLMLGLTCMNLA